MRMNLALLFAVIQFIPQISFGQGIKELDFLIGEWNLEETIFPDTEDEYKEQGRRVCEYYLNEIYIKCESSTIVSKDERVRKYVYLINYDQKENYFRVTSLASDFPLHGQHRWYLDKENSIIQAITPKNVIDGYFYRGTIEFSNSKRIVWNAWRSMYNQDKEWQKIFTDIITN